LDAAEKVVKSNAEIRQVLIDYDRTNSGATNYPALFAKSDVVKTGGIDLYEGLDKDGSPVVMNIEMNALMTEDATKCNGKKCNINKGAQKPTAKAKGTKKK
jgi:hypothetical protein